jgi:hypothetical protein
MSISVLHDDALSSVLELFENGYSCILRLVCKRWNSIVRTKPTIAGIASVFRAGRHSPGFIRYYTALNTINRRVKTLITMVPMCSSVEQRHEESVILDVKIVNVLFPEFKSVIVETPRRGKGWMIVWVYH